MSPFPMTFRINFWACVCVCVGVSFSRRVSRFPVSCPRPGPSPAPPRPASGDGVTLRGSSTSGRLHGFGSVETWGQNYVSCKQTIYIYIYTLYISISICLFIHVNVCMYMFISVTIDLSYTNKRSLAACLFTARAEPPAAPGRRHPGSLVRRAFAPG